ncbi:MAG: cupin domain-containing protein [Pseudomonadota bacterium]
MNNIFNHIPKNLKTEVVEQLINNNQVKIERIISKGHRSPESGWYDQEHNEWVIVLSGEAILSFVDDLDISMKKGDYINIPAHKKHKVKWTAPNIETIWLAVHY